MHMGCKPGFQLGLYILVLSEGESYTSLSLDEISAIFLGRQADLSQWVGLTTVLIS